jgi:uncharacterized protein (DUF111 family)
MPPLPRESLPRQGAWEVTYSPAQTKKNRPAVRLEAVCPPDLALPLAELVLEQSTSLGLRVRNESRWCLERKPGEVKVLGTPLPGKWARRPSGRWEFKPEYESCQALASLEGLSVGQVLRLANNAAEQEAMEGAAPNPGSEGSS